MEFYKEFMENQIKIIEDLKSNHESKDILDRIQDDLNKLNEQIKGTKFRFSLGFSDKLFYINEFGESLPDEVYQYLNKTDEK